MESTVDECLPYKNFYRLLFANENLQKRNDEKGPPRKIDMALLNSIPKRHLERESVDRVGSAATKGFRQSQPGSYRFKNPVNFMMIESLHFLYWGIYRCNSSLIYLYFIWRDGRKGHYTAPVSREQPQSIIFFAPSSTLPHTL